MSFPRYPSYKDSGVEWWGDMPQEWGLFPAKRSFIRRKNLNTGMKCENRLSLTLGGVVPRDLDDLDGLQASEFETYQLFSANDLVFKLIDLQNIKTSRVGLVPELGIMSPAYIRVEPNRTKVIPKFAYWFFTNLYNRCIFNELGGGVRQTISSEELLLLPYPTLPLPEQTQIAAFLDRETAKIDDLVAEQRRLMELLKEKRQAVISHAVTKGLNPDAPMKPSGIEWLGEVPAHWDTYLLKRAFRSVDYGISDSLDSDGAVAILRMGNIQNGKVVTDDLKYTDSVDPYLLLKAGDLLYNRTNSLDLIGKVGMFIGNGDTPVSFASYLVRMRTVDEVIADYFAYLLNTEGILGLARCNALVAIGQCNLNPTRYGQITIAIPPRAEQAAIVAFLNAEIAKLDTLTAEAQHSIDLLQERRTALISAAVTGHIDVRQLAERQAA